MSPPRVHPAPSGYPSSRRRDGFTLIELMIVLVIIGIIAAIAIPSYQQHVMRSRRGEAQTALSQVAQAQERWRSNNSSYAADFATLFPNGAPGLTHYDLTLTTPPAPNANYVYGYEIHAKPRAGSPQVKDTQCADMFIRVAAGNLTYRDSTMAANDVTSVCWPQ